MREKLQDIRDDNYERPNQAWVCALLDEGGTCPVGPTRWGRCPEATACHPVIDGERWRCNRSDHRGGPCDDGPTPDGQCSHLYQCSPLKSLRLRRMQFVFGCLVFCVGALLVLLNSSDRNEFLAPGPLTTHHAQLVSRGEATNRCASCHAAGNQTFAEWVSHAVDDELATPAQTDLCMECHRKQFTSESARWAHNIQPDELIARKSSENSLPPESRAVDPTQPITCSACHREHHGAEHDLTRVSDAACQTCHAEAYHSFADDHPEFTAWPARRRTRIIFDHAAHQAKHFVTKQAQFDCSQCHVADEVGAFQTTLSFEATCAKCHDEDLANSWTAGIEVFSVPMLDTAALEEAGASIGDWPEDATDEFDGALPPITKLLLASDEDAAKGLRLLGSDFDFFDVDPDDEVQLAEAADIVWATKRLYYDLATQGQGAIKNRLEKILGRDIPALELADLTARIAPENLAGLTKRWLRKLPEELAEESEVSSALLPNESSGASQDRETARSKVSAGGWFSDELTLSVRYQATGHADPLITAWLNVLAEASGGTHSDLVEPLLRQQILPTAAGQCGSCHSLDRSSDNRLQINWLAKQPHDRNDGFTMFHHGPHLSQAQLADCQACHAIDVNAVTKTSYQQDSPHEFVDGFQPLTRVACAECHTPQGAGDSCITCHRYHVGH